MMMTKGSEVEVCSQEEGLKGAYFRAVLEENPTKSGRKKLCIRYMTLLSQDGSSPLTETVQQSLLRPVPPEEEYAGVVLEEGTVVDADHREGWWTGVVINKKFEDDNYLVYFDSPPDIIKFDKTKLRAHVDWTGSKWVRPENKELDKSMFSPGTMVEVSSSIDKAEVAWFPAMLIKKIEDDGEKKFIVKDCNQHLSHYGEDARPNTTVDPRRVRPTPPPFSVQNYNLLDCVEAFHGSVWRQGLVKGVLSGKCYMVSLEATKEEHGFKHSHLRPLRVWEDGDWHNGPKPKPPVEETPSSIMKTKPVRSSSGAKPMTPKRAITPKRDRKHVRRSLTTEENGEKFTEAETVAATGELRNKSADAVMNDETPPVIIPQVTSIAKEPASVVTPSPPVITATPLKQTEPETEEQPSSEKTSEPRSKQNGLENGSTRQKELDKSMFSPGAMVEVSSSIDKAEVGWFPAMLIKEIEEDGEKKFIVNDFNQPLSRYGEEARPNTTVDPRHVRPTPPPFSVEGYKLLDCVEAFHGSIWRQGLVRGVLSGNCYMVSLQATKEEHVFKHSHVRPLKVWEDGDWHNGPKRKPPVEETPSSVIKTKPVRSSSGAKRMTRTPKRAITPKRDRKHVRRSLNPEEIGEKFTQAETVAATGELRNKRADAVMNDETPLVIVPQVTSIAKESASVVTPSPPVITVTPLKQTETEIEEQQASEKTPDPRRKQNGLENESTRQKMLEEDASEGKSRKRKREEKQHSDLDETDGTCNGSKADINDRNKDICNGSDVDDQLISSLIGNLSTEVSCDQSPNVMLNSAAPIYVEETPKIMALPFAKRSPYWKRCEATEGYKSVPQRPHFIPLLEEAKDDIREWSAVGMMVTFYGLLDEVKELKPDDSTSVFCSLNDSFAELEKHGFDIAAPQSRISKMRYLKDERAKKAEEKQCFGNKIVEDEKESSKLEEEMSELKRKILELQRQEAVAKEKKEAVDKRIVEMKSSEERIYKEIEDMELEILKTASAPW